MTPEKTQERLERLYEVIRSYHPYRENLPSIGELDDDSFDDFIKLVRADYDYMTRADKLLRSLADHLEEEGFTGEDDEG